MDELKIVFAGIPLTVEFFLNEHGHASAIRAVPVGLPREYDLVPYLNDEAYETIRNQIESSM